MVRILPMGAQSSLTDAGALNIAKDNSKVAHADFNFSVASTSSNAHELASISGKVASLFIPLNHLSNNINKVAAVTSHFDVWPEHKPIMTDAKTTDLASILLLASLHNRKVHVTSVSTNDDIKLISLSKAKGLKVTCDVSVYSLFLTREDYPECHALPTVEDQRALWSNLSTIDCFSVGTLPYQLAHDARQAPSNIFGIADTLPLLFTAVSEGRLTVQDIITRLHDNPKIIFDLHEQPDSAIEIEFGRSYVAQAGSVWSPLVGRTLKGLVKRVTFQDKTVSLDGNLTSDGTLGRDWSVHAFPVAPTQIASPAAASNDAGFSSPRLGANARLQSLVTEAPLTAGASFVPVPQMLPQPVNPSVSQALAELLSKDSMFKRRHILSVSQFSRADLHHLFTVASEMRLGVERCGSVEVHLK